MAADFTLEGYSALIEALRARGYEARFFADAEPEKRHLILRHDLDVSIEAALSIAEAESALGVRASYFVLVRSGLYNPFSPANRDALARLRTLGHEIGLHLDASLYDGDAGALDDAAERECAVLETIIEASVAMISFHRPAQALLGRSGRVAGRAHAYEPRFFHDIGYCSDSRGGWHHGHPLDHPALGEGRALQLLTHPVWWTARRGEDMQGRIDRFADERAGAIRRELAANIETYAKAARRGEEK